MTAAAQRELALSALDEAIRLVGDYLAANVNGSDWAARALLDMPERLRAMRAVFESETREGR
jgi:hypothetical protein